MNLIVLVDMRRRLHLFTKKNKYINYKLGWTTHTCNIATNGYNGSIAVIDSSE